MNLLEQPAALREAVAAFVAFRRLGFPSSAIYLAPSDGRVAMTVKWEGEDFTVACGVADGMTREEISRKWWAIASAIQRAPQDELDQLYGESLVRRQSFDMVVALQAKGLHPPACRHQDPTGMQRFCQDLLTSRAANAN